MICKCKTCGKRFEATEQHALEVLTGGKDCPACKELNGIYLIEMDSAKLKR